VYSPVYAPMYRCKVLSRKLGVVGFPPTNCEHFEPWIWIRFSSSKVGSWYQPWEPTAFLFSGCNPYLGGLKPSFFTGTWGPIGKFLFFFWWIRGPLCVPSGGLSSKSLGGNLVQIRIYRVRTSPGSDKKHPWPHLYLNWWSVTFFFLKL